MENKTPVKLRIITILLCQLLIGINIACAKNIVDGHKPCAKKSPSQHILVDESCNYFVSIRGHSWPKDKFEQERTGIYPDESKQRAMIKKVFDPKTNSFENIVDVIDVESFVAVKLGSDYFLKLYKDKNNWYLHYNNFLKSKDRENIPIIKEPEFEYFMKDTAMALVKIAGDEIIPYGCSYFGYKDKLYATSGGYVVDIPAYNAMQIGLAQFIVDPQRPLPPPASCVVEMNDGRIYVRYRLETRKERIKKINYNFIPIDKAKERGFNVMSKIIK